MARKTGKQFSLSKRKGSKIYYCQFKKDDGTWSNAITTGESSKIKAEIFAIEYISKSSGRIIDRNSITFEQFSNGFFDWNNDWAIDKRSMGKRLSERQCGEKQRQVEKHLIPVFGNMKLNDIGKDNIKSLRNNLFKDGFSSSYINKVLSNLNTILITAYEQDLIQSLPKVDRVANKTTKQKGILTIEETKQLFSFPWPDYLAYVMNITAASTGLRRGELQALQIKNFHGEYLDIDKSYDSRMRRLNSTTKNGRSRRVIIPVKVRAELEELISINPYRSSEAFIFFSDSPDRPVHGEYINTCLYKAMKAIGIDEEIRKERGITFHSWRSAFNTWLISARIPLAKVMSLTGHLSREMAEDIYFKTDDFQDVKLIQESIFH